MVSVCYVYVAGSKASVAVQAVQSLVVDWPGIPLTLNCIVMKDFIKHIYRFDICRLV